MKILWKFVQISIIGMLMLSACGALPDESSMATQIANQVLTALAAGGAASETPAATSAAVVPSETPSGPVVVFLAEGTFSEDEKNQIQNRVVAPFIHYHADLEGHPPLVSISIERSSALAEYPFSANAIFETGITMGWLVRATAGAVDWWIPECMVACVLSDSFRAAYPQIVATLEP